MELIEDERWLLNPILDAHLKSFNVTMPNDGPPEYLAAYLKVQLGNRAVVKTDSYVGLFSSQQMVCVKGSLIQYCEISWLQILL